MGEHKSSKVSDTRTVDQGRLYAGWFSRHAARQGLVCISPSDG